MPQNNDSAKWLKPFLSGILITVATYHVIPKLFSKNMKNDDATSCSSDNDSKVTYYHENATAPINIVNKPLLMDSPTLDQRILRKAEGALQKRTSRLIVVIERCSNDYNYSAILRTAEALGIQHIYIIDPKTIKSTLMVDECNSDAGASNNTMPYNSTCSMDDDTPNSNTCTTATTEQDTYSKDNEFKLYRSTGQKVKNSTREEIKHRANHHLFAQKALEWLDVTEFDTTKECIDDLKQKGYQIWSTDLSQVAVCLTKEGLQADDECRNNNDHTLIPDKLAVVFGTEAVGCTTEILNASDKRVYLPLRGFADSLNLSVATALVLHQLFTLDPTLIGSMTDEERIEIRRKWYTKLASQRMLSKSMKQQRRRLKAQINNCINLEAIGKTQTLQKQQLEKLATLPKLREELKLIDEELYENSKRAIEDLVHNPPTPLDDMRRADEHRTTFVGKNTKRNQGGAWDDMPATMNSRSEDFISASFFRERAKIDKDVNM